MGADRFINRKDGTAVDTHTGLMWMRGALGQEWNGVTANGVAIEYAWTEAINIFPFEFAGYNDWRLPDFEELQSIVDRTARSPKIDISVFRNAPPTNFWSLTCHVDGMCHRYVEAHYINFASGNSHKASTNYRLNVRLVRKESITALAGILPGGGPVVRSLITLGNPQQKNIHRETIDANGVISENDEKLTVEVSVATARSLIGTALELIRKHPTPFEREISELRQLLAIKEETSATRHANELAEIGGDILPAALDGDPSLLSILRGLSTLQSVSVSTLRHYLFPLDLMPNAVMDEVNEKAFDLVGEPALEEDGERVTVYREVLIRVLETWDTPSARVID